MSVVVATPDYATFFGTIGVASAVALTAIGSAYATAKAGVAVAAISVMRPELTMKSLLPVIMGGIVAIYGLVVAIVLLSSVTPPYTAIQGFYHLASGMCVGICGIAAGMAIGIIGDAGLRAFAQQQRLFIGLIVLLVFAEVLGLYGFIIGILIGLKAK
uniref:V-type proton ATPase proteolipid subunit n=1 Tax=Myxobolus squamalis TaxID=59785 RepID=A0A6B2G0Y7_MYXSQ